MDESQRFNTVDNVTTREAFRPPLGVWRQAWPQQSGPSPGFPRHAIPQEYLNATAVSNHFRLSPRQIALSCRYSALFVDEDPDVDLGGAEGGGPAGGRKDRGVSIMGSGHVRLRQKEAAQGRGGRARSDGDRELWASASSDEEGEPLAGVGRQSTPRNVSTVLQHCGMVGCRWFTVSIKGSLKP